MTSPWDSIKSADEKDALHQISLMLTGTRMMQDEPGVVYSLHQAQARPQDAQAIDQFMQALDLEKQVEIHRAASEPLKLDPTQQSMLKNNGVAFDDVLWTPKSAAQTAVQRTLDASNGKMTVKLNNDGSLNLDKNGQIQYVKTQSKHDDGNWFTDAVGSVGSAIKGAATAGLHGLQKGYNYVATGVDKGFHGIENDVLGMGGGSNPQNEQAAAAAAQSKNTDKLDMQAQGYDPNSFWSTQAFMASGRAHSDLSGLIDKYGLDKVDEGLKFLKDPKTYRTSVENDPTNFQKDANGQTVLSAQGQSKMSYLGSNDFNSLIRRINAHQATVGNDFANALGIDPVKDATTYTLTAAGTNLVASFVIDPTIAGLGAVKALKTWQVGLETLGDADTAAAILTRQGFFARSVQRGWQRAIDYGQQMRLAHAAGDDVKLAQLTAKFNAELPALSPLMTEFVGKHALTGWRNPSELELAKGIKGAQPILGETGGIQTLDQAAAFVRSKWGMSLLRNGRAATQSSLMPGAVSAFGYRKLKGVMSGWMTARSATRAQGAFSEVVSRAEADPLGLGAKLVDEGTLVRLPAEADDAITLHNDNLLAYKPVGSASDALGNLMGLAREGAPAIAERAALSDELDALESRLQGAMGDKLTSPESLADMHDAISTGRQLIGMVDSGLAPKLAQIKTAQAALRKAEESINTAENAGTKSLENGAEAKAAGGGDLASAQRAQYEVTYAGKGDVLRNLRKTGDPLADASRLGYFSPTAIASRARLAAVRLSTLLPRNTVVDINDARAGDTIYKMAMTYLDRGNAQALRAAWNFGGPGERKAIVHGLIDQIGHAAGLGKSPTGKAILDRAKTADEAYSVAGSDIKLNGEPMALFEGQTRARWTLPSFQAINQASAKIGLWESTLGRAMSSTQADKLMAQWKMGALFKPSTVTRNQLEGWLRTILEGRAGDAIKARALATSRNKELWARGHGTADLDAYTAARGKVEGLQQMLKGGGLSKAQRADAQDQIRAAQRAMDEVGHTPIVQHRLATEAGDTELAKQIENGSMLHGEVLGRSAPATKLADLAPLAWIGRSYRAMVGQFMDKETVDALLTLSPQELADAMEGYGQQILSQDLGFANAVKEAGEISKAGYGPSKVRWAVHRSLERGRKGSEAAADEQTRWTMQALDDTVGADRYANALHQRIDAMPQTTRAVLDYVQDPALGLKHIVSAADQEMTNTAWGRVFFPDPIGAPTAARSAATAAEEAQGKLDWARKLVDEHTTLMSGRNGEFQQELADYVYEHGHAPDADWISSNLKNDQRPEAALAPEVMAMPSGGIRSIAQTLQDVEGGAYQWMVERPLQRTTSSPVFLANYAIERKGLNTQVSQMVAEAGISEEAANALAKELATRNAWIKTEQLIDDPGQKAQFDVIARNMIPFARATQAMIRRWGTGLWQNPVAARKMMLAYEGAVQSGLIYQNAYGEPTFTYPGSAVFNQAMRALSNVPGFDGIAAFPVSSDMTGGVLMAVPGADNPFRMSMGPMISVPVRLIYENLLPTAWRGSLMKTDEVINGPIGAGETFSQFVPTAIRKAYVAMDGDARNSAMASAMNGAIANLAAAGLLPPPDASPAVIQQFRSRLQSQVKNQLYWRAAFALFAPSAPSSPTEATDASTKVDYAWAMDGIKNLSDEYKQVLNETGGDVGRTNAIFTALHPDEVAYKEDGTLESAKLPASAFETAKSSSTASGAYLPATAGTFQWLTDHESFVKKYGSVAAYFLPDQASNQPFSQAAYQAQIQMGLRQRKTPGEFMSDVYTKHAEQLFYPAVDEWNRRIQSAKDQGDSGMASQLTAMKSQWEKDFKTRNPMLGAKMDDYGAARQKATQQLDNMREMLSKGEVPDGLSGKLKQLVTAYDNYEAFRSRNAGSDQASNAARASALDTFNTWAGHNLAGTPLADLFNGVFRVLNTNLDRLAGSD